MNESIREGLKKYIQKTGISQSALSKKIDISNGALSLIINDKYPNETGATIDKIKNFLSMHEKEQGYVKKIEFVETSIVKKVINTISYCHIQKVMGIVYGDAGIGKTEAIHAYMDSNIDAIKINCVPACAKPKAFLKKLCRKLRLQGGKNEDEYYDDIVEKLEGTNKILILDEAQHLPYKTLEHVRSIYDETGIGIILIGNHQIHDKLLGIQEAAFAQLFNRIAIRNPLSTNDVRIEDIQLIFGNIPKQSLEYLLNVANSTKWGIRGAVNVYMNAANNDDISVKGLQKMACFMGIYESR